MHADCWQVLLQGLVKQLARCCSTTSLKHLLLSNMSSEGLLGTQQLPQTTSLLEAHTPEEIRPARARQATLRGWTWTKLGSRSPMQQTNYLQLLMVAAAIGRSPRCVTRYQHLLLMLSATLFWQIQKCSSVQIRILSRIPKYCRTVLEIAGFPPPVVIHSLKDLLAGGDLSDWSILEAHWQQRELKQAEFLTDVVICSSAW